MNLVILHGLYMHGMVMQPLSQKLKSLGYQTRVVSYNTLDINENQLFEEIDEALDKSQANALIGHSLGGLMSKHYLDARQPDIKKLSHVVTIGSPLRGASIVTKIQQMGLGGVIGNSRLYGLESHYNTWRFEQKLGSIAGNLPLGFRPMLMGRGKESDGTVTVRETKIEGMTDHVVLRNSHTSLIYSSKTLHQIDHFLTHDRFDSLAD